MPDDYVAEDYKRMRAHKWYMSGRQITMNDIYSFDPNLHVELDEFTDIIGRNFKQPSRGPGLRQQPGRPHVALDHPAGEVPVAAREGVSETSQTSQTPRCRDAEGAAHQR